MVPLLAIAAPRPERMSISNSTLGLELSSQDVDTPR